MSEKFTQISLKPGFMQHNGGVLFRNISDNQYKDKHHYFFFEGKKEFIDADNEWLLDTVNDVLYLKPASGVNLATTPIRGKVRDYSITITGDCNGIISNLSSYGCSCKINTTCRF